MKVLFHAIPVIPIESVIGSDPYKTLLVFGYAIGIISAKSVLSGKMIELQFREYLGCCGLKGEA